MALTLHQSNRIENLLYCLKILVEENPLSHAFAPEEIILSAPGVKRCIDRYLAQEWGVAANIRYENISVLFWRILFICLKNVPEENHFSPNLLRWHIFEILHHNHNPHLREALDDYVHSHHNAANELSEQLAILFEQYLVYRPQWLDNWVNGDLNHLGDNEVWQQILWQQIYHRICQPHRDNLWQSLLQQLQQKNLSVAQKFPERVIIFGVSTLAPMMMHFLEALSHHCDVHLLALNPCAQYWGDIRTIAEQTRYQQGEITAFHPLLARWGKQGRDFFDLLSDLSPIGDDVDLFHHLADSHSASLLNRLQDDIQNNTPPQKLSTPEDGSVVIASSFSPLRELQAVREEILHFLEHHPEYSPDDIAVLSPNIEQYAPFIAPVFEGQLPFSIADTKLRGANPYFQAWKMLLDLFNSRLEVDRVIALLNNTCVMAHFEFSEDDCALMQWLIHSVHIHWGWDATERANFGDNSDMFTWKSAFQRIISGALMPTGSLWGKIIPFDVPLTALPVISRWVALMDTVQEARTLWKGDATVEVWANRIRTIGANLLGEECEEAVDLMNFVDQWVESCRTAQLTVPLSAFAVSSHLSRALDQPQEAHFLSGGITFGSMIPLRNLPFAFLALLGLNDGDFPRPSTHLPFDLMASNKAQKGDRSRRDDDRYLFLESLMSAREVLYLSYIGRNIHNNELLPPSELISALQDVLNAMTHYPPAVREHPLHPFSKRYFTGENLVSYRADYCAMIQSKIHDNQPFIDNQLSTESLFGETIDWEKWLKFWQNPPRYWLQHALLLSAPFEESLCTPDEPFDLPDVQAVETAYLTGENPHITGQKLTAQNLLPCAQLGEIWREKLNNLAQHLQADDLEKPDEIHEFSLKVGRHIFTGSLFNLHRRTQKQIFIEGRYKGKLTMTCLLAAYFHHLLISALDKGNWQTILLTLEERAVFAPIHQTEAQSRLNKWLDYATQNNHPLPFYPSLSMSFFTENGNNYIQYAQKKWEGKEYPIQNRPEMRMIYHQSALYEDPIFVEMIENLLVDMKSSYTLIEQSD